MQSVPTNPSTFNTLHAHADTLLILQARLQELQQKNIHTLDVLKQTQEDLDVLEEENTQRFQMQNGRNYTCVTFNDNHPF